MKRIAFEGYDWILVDFPKNSFGYEVKDDGVEYSYFEEGKPTSKTTLMEIEDMKEGKWQYIWGVYSKPKEGFVVDFLDIFSREGIVEVFKKEGYDFDACDFSLLLVQFEKTKEEKL